MADDAAGKAGSVTSTTLLGCSIQFRDGSTARLGVHLIARKLFREARTGRILDLNEMLSGYCRQAGVAPEKVAARSAAAKAPEQGAGPEKPAFTVAFAPGVFGFRANEGMKDIERIDFDVELIVPPRERS